MPAPPAEDWMGSVMTKGMDNVRLLMWPMGQGPMHPCPGTKQGPGRLCPGANHASVAQPAKAPRPLQRPQVGTKRPVGRRFNPVAWPKCRLEAMLGRTMCATASQRRLGRVVATAAGASAVIADDGWTGGGVGCELGGGEKTLDKVLSVVSLGGHAENNNTTSPDLVLWRLDMILLSFLRPCDLATLRFLSPSP